VLDRLIARTESAARVLLWIAIAAGLLMMLHVTADVIGRTVFNHPLAGTTEIVSGYYMIAVSFLPWAWISAKEGHIRVEIFTTSMSPRRRAWLDVGVALLTLAYVAAFTWQTFERAVHATAVRESWEAPSGFLPVWLSHWLLPLGGALMAAYLLLWVLAEIARLARGHAGARA